MTIIFLPYSSNVWGLLLFNTRSALFMWAVKNIEIEGFGGKRALGILRKIELCQKRSSHAVLFRCLYQCSACFFPEACFLF